MLHKGKYATNVPLLNITLIDSPLFSHVNLRQHQSIKK